MTLLTQPLKIMSTEKLLEIEEVIDALKLLVVNIKEVSKDGYDVDDLFELLANKELRESLDRAFVGIGGIGGELQALTLYDIQSLIDRLMDLLIVLIGDVKLSA